MAISDLINEQTALVEESNSFLKELGDKVSYQTTATAEQILAGFIGAYNGELVEGVASSGYDASAFGFTKMAVDTFTPSSDTTATTSVEYTMSHSLGERPKVVILLTNTIASTTYAVTHGMYGTQFANSRMQLFYYGGSNVTSAPATTTLTDTAVGVKPVASTISFKFMAGVEYTLITLGGEAETISFTIDGTTYTAEEGMTWTSWVASDYNTGGFTQAGAQNIINSAGTLAVSDGSNYVRPSDIIISGHAYTLA